MPTKEQLESALVNADKAGDVEAAKTLANAIKNKEFDTSPDKKARDSVALNTFREGLQGLTLGFSDELGAAAAAGLATVLDGADFSEARESIIADIRREQEAFREDEPVISLAAQVVGGAATGGAGLAKTIGKQAGKSALKRVGSNAAVGAAEGAVAGVGFNEGEDRITGGLTGAALGAGLGAAAGEVTQIFKNRSATKEAAESVLKSREETSRALVTKGGTPPVDESKFDVAAAGFKLEKGRAVKDPVQQEALRQGFDEGTVSLITGSNNSDRRKMLQMVNILEGRDKNKRFSALNRTEDVTGQSVAKRIQKVWRENRAASRAVGRAAESLKTEQVDLTPVANDFVADLQDLRINLNQNIEGRFVPDFSRSVIKNKGVRSALKEVISDVQDMKTAFDAHIVKRQIDDLVTYGKNQTGLSGQGERLLKDLRRGIDQALDASFPDYKAANDLYSSTVTVLDDIQRSAGSKIDILDDASGKALGRWASGVLSNNRGRKEVIDALNDLDVLARELGGDFDDDIISQIIFSDELQQIFGVEAQKSLGGEAAKAVKSGVRAGLGDASDLVGEGVNRAADAITGVSRENALKAIRDLLIQGGK